MIFVDPCIIVRFIKKNPTRFNNVSKCYYSIFIWSSTRFGRHTAHHQEPKTALAATCWASYKYGIIKFWYIVASCWIFLYEMLHGTAYTRVHITWKCASHDIAHFLWYWTLHVYKWYCVQCCIAALHTVSFVHDCFVGKCILTGSTE
jgi:hypothetical protein